MDQESFDFQPLSRRTDPVTSKRAAESMVIGASKQREAVYWAILQAGRPITADEISVRCGLSKVQVCRRLPELEREGRAVPTDETRPTPSGRAARCWRLRRVSSAVD